MKSLFISPKHFYSSLLRFGPYLFWSILFLTTYLLLIELTPSKNGLPYFDKIVHVILFSILSFLGVLSYQKRKIMLCISLVIYGLLTEWLQDVLTVSRFPSILDWLADITGILIGAILINYLLKRIHSS